jgi:hypothetical protein
MFKRELKMHHAQVESWRSAEAYHHGRCSHSPWLETLLLNDDTSALGLPYFTTRDYKSLGGKHKVMFIPWLVEDVARYQFTHS